MPTRRVLGVLVAVGIVAVVPHTGGAAGTDDPEALLERARVASVRQSFTGGLALTWLDGRRIHSAVVVARAAHGSIRLGFEPVRVAARGLERWTGDQEGWHGLWSDSERVPGPPAGSHWDLTIGGERRVAGRAATLVVASDPDTGKPRARFWVDKERGLLLRRDVLDEQGRVVRSIGFVVIHGLGDAPRPGAPSAGTGSPPRKIVRAPEGYRAPAHTAGYDLLGSYRHDDGTVQLFYSDGLFNLSVFEQTGEVDWNALPEGTDRDLDGTKTRSYATPTSTVVVWGDAGFAITCVGDAPPDEIDAIVRNLRTADDDSILDDIADFVLGPFGWD